MKSLRKILFPFSLIYGGITSFRNFLYDKGVFQATCFELPIIAVGNLSVGGTGKTPMVEYLIRLLSDKYKLATLSRGYKRKSEGFYLANSKTKMEHIGDEPFQYHSKFKNISVAVDANRVNGVQNLLEKIPDLELILLDDAFQHRSIKAGFYIMLTAYDDLYYQDLLLPAGNLRESKSGVKRADVVVITKCPENLLEVEMQQIRNRMKIENTSVFFSTISYSPFVTNGKEQKRITDFSDDFIAVAGIAKPHYFYNYLKCTSENILTFRDHHHFTDMDIQRILEKAQNRKIITTEKDYMRLQNLLPQEQLYCLPIEMKFLEGSEQFDEIINTFVDIS